MARLYTLVARFVWDVVEVIGLAFGVFAVFVLFGRGWGLLAIGVVLVLVANIRGR